MNCLKSVFMLKFFHTQNNEKHCLAGCLGKAVKRYGVFIVLLSPWLNRLDSLKLRQILTIGTLLGLFLVQRCKLVRTEILNIISDACVLRKNGVAMFKIKDALNLSLLVKMT